MEARVFDSKGPDESALNKDGFVGVDPIYQNFANKTDEPLEGSEDEEEEKEPEAKPRKAAKADDSL